MPLNKSNERKGTCLSILSAICWGLVANAGEFLVGSKGMDPLQVTSVRLIIAGIILLAFSTVRKNRVFSVWKERRDRIELLVTGLIGFGVCQATYFISIQHSNGGTASVIQNTAPVMVLVYTLIHERRKPAAYEMISVLAVIAGAFILATGGKPGSLAISGVGLTTGIISAAAVALYSILPERLMGKFGSLTITGWGLLLGGMLLLPVSKPWDIHGTLDGSAIMVFTYLVLIGTVTTFGLYMSSLPMIGAFKAAVICLLEPVVATFVTVFAFNTRFTTAEFIGIAVILLGILVLTLASRNQDSKA